MEKHEAGGVIAQAAEAVSAPTPLEEDAKVRLKLFMATLEDIVDSPKAHMIFTNAALTLLELPEKKLTAESVFELLTDDQVRTNAIEKLSGETPPFWSEAWNSLWRKDLEPLSSEAHQRMARRISLVTFWREEWSSIPAETRRHAAEMVKAIAGGGAKTA